MTQKLMLIDGHALMHRAFHALPELTTTSGELVNAVFGWTSIVIKALDTLRPTHVVAAFDLPVPTFRHDQYADYKATRAKTPRPLSLQFDRVRQVAAAFNIPIVEEPGYEADDVLGTLAHQAEGIGVPSVIVTGDLDTLQLVDDYVTVLTSKRQLSETILYDRSGVNQRFGLEPSQLPDLKGLIGDTSDNIPGVRGIGEKTAAKLLFEFGSLEGIYEHLEEVPNKQRDLLAAARDQAFRSRELARIVSAPVALDLPAAAVEEIDLPRLVALFRELEFRSLIPRLQALHDGGAPSSPHGASTAVEQLSLFDTSLAGGSATGAPQQPGAGGKVEPGPAPERGQAKTVGEAVPAVRVHAVTTEEQLQELVEGLRSRSPWALVVEMEGPRTFDGDLVGLAFSFGEEEAWYVPIASRGTEASADGHILDPLKSLAALAPVLEDPNIKKLGHDLKQAVLVLAGHGIGLEGLGFDTMLASYLENASGRLLALDALAAQYLGREIVTREGLAGRGRKQVPLADLPLQDVAGYSGGVADAVARLAPILQERLHHRKLLPLLYDVEMPLIRVLAGMERAGVALDCDLLLQMSQELAFMLDEIQGRIFQRVGHAFNINSPPQLGEVLFKELNLKKSRRTKTGYSTDSEVLEKLRGVDPVIDDVLEFRQLMKLKGTYVDALPALLSPRDGRLHTDFNQAVATTGRLSSSNPNLQNIPIRSEIGHRIRQAFIPDVPDHAGKPVILAADYSQIELRVLAHLSGDPRLISAFLNDQDIHAVTAAAVWAVEPDRITSDQRRIAKVVNFGIAYGIGDQRLAYETGLSRDEAAAFIDSYRKTYAGVTDFMEGTRSHAQLYGQVSTLLGRVRSVPEIHSNHPGLRQAAERAAINMPVQGTAADIMKVAMIRVADQMRKQGVSSRMLLQVHDELVFEVPSGEVDLMAELVREAMRHAVELSVPLGVEVNVGPNWGDLRRYQG